MLTKLDKNYIFNMLLAIVIIVCVFTGIFYNDGLGLVHDATGALMAILVFVHVVLHFQWIKSTTKSILSDKKKLIALILTLVISIGACTFLFLNINNFHRESDRFRRQFRNTLHINS